MIQVTLSGKSLAEIATAASALALEIGGLSAPKESAASKAAAASKESTTKAGTISAADKRKLAASSTVVEPKGDAEAETEVEADAETEVEETTETAADPSEALTADDVRAVLIEVREAMPNSPSIISEIVQKFGKKKLSDLDEKDFPAVVKHAKELLAKSKADKKNKAK